MFVLILVGFLVGTYAVALIAKFVGGALKPTLPSLDAPTRKVVVRRRTVQVGQSSESRPLSTPVDGYDQRMASVPRASVPRAGVPRPKVVELV